MRAVPFFLFGRREIGYDRCEAGFRTESCSKEGAAGETDQEHDDLRYGKSPGTRDPKSVACSADSREIYPYGIIGYPQYAGVGKLYAN